MKYFLTSAVNTWISSADDQIVSNWAGILRVVFGNILSFIRIIGTGTALIMLTWMSMNYFSANGKSAPWAAERTADVKGRQLMNFAVGALIFIGAGNIVWFIVQFLVQIIGEFVSI